MATASGPITIDENNNQFFFCDGINGYTFTYGTNAFAQITDPDFPSPGSITFLDSYAIVNENGTGRFYISAPNNATSWDALDFATAESSPDRLLRVINAFGQLFLFGEKTTEIWTNTGASDFPFARIAGAKMDVGILSPFSAQDIDNQIVWVGRDEFGSGIVYSATGFTPQRISTETIERRINEATDRENITSWVYQEDGHRFYVLTGGGLETSLTYDLTTQLWHEKSSLDGNGNFAQHLGTCHMFAFGKNLVGSRTTGRLYEQSLDIFDDDGASLVRERIYTHLSDEDRRVRYNVLDLGFETGVGLQTGYGEDPQVAMQLSKDGARTYSNWYTTSIGRVGKYKQKVSFRRLGIAEQMTFRIRTSAPVKISVTGSYLR